MSHYFQPLSSQDCKEIVQRYNETLPQEYSLYSRDYSNNLSHHWQKRNLAASIDMIQQNINDIKYHEQFISLDQNDETRQAHAIIIKQLTAEIKDTADKINCHIMTLARNLPSLAKSR